MAKRSRRVVEIRTWLEGHLDAPDELKIAPLDELGRLLADLGDLDEAMAHWPEVEFPFHRRRSDARAMAITMGKIAELLKALEQTTHGPSGS